jgi:hypothetical protein
MNSIISTIYLVCVAFVTSSPPTYSQLIWVGSVDASSPAHCITHHFLLIHLKIIYAHNKYPGNAGRPVNPSWNPPNTSFCVLKALNTLENCSGIVSYLKNTFPLAHVHCFNYVPLRTKYLV